MADVQLSTRGSVIKTAYEGQADTNAFTDSEKSKLAGIEAAADVTDAANVAAAGAVMTSAIGVDVQAYHANLAALAGISAAPPVQTLDIAVSSAEILALHTTPKTLVAAPGANKALIPELAIFFLDYNSAAYSGIAVADNMGIYHTSASGQFLIGCETTGFMDQTSDQRRLCYPYAPLLPAIAPELNAPLVLAIVGDGITTGNSPMGVRIFYRTVDLSTLSAT